MTDKISAAQECLEVAIAALREIAECAAELAAKNGCGIRCDCDLCVLGHKAQSALAEIRRLELLT